MASLSRTFTVSGPKDLPDPPAPDEAESATRTTTTKGGDDDKRAITPMVRR